MDSGPGNPAGMLKTLDVLRAGHDRWRQEPRAEAERPTPEDGPPGWAADQLR